MTLLAAPRPEIDLDQVRAALGAVHDPEIDQPLAKLGMLGEITARRGRVRVEVRLTTESCPLVGELRRAVTAVVAVEQGVRDVEVAFTTMAPRELAELADRLKRAATPLNSTLGIGGTRVYAVASGKGGVGKSTVTANLAAALATGGHRVGVLDADVWGYSIPQLFGARRSPVVLGELMMPVPAHGVGLMSMGFFVNEEQPVIWRGPMLHKALRQFVTDTYWGHLDALLVDLPPGTGDATLSLFEFLPDATLLAVTTTADHRPGRRRQGRADGRRGRSAGGGNHRKHVSSRMRRLRRPDLDLRHRRRRAARRGDRRTAARPGPARHRAASGG